MMIGYRYPGLRLLRGELISDVVVLTRLAFLENGLDESGI